MILILALIALLLFIIERIWPANELPKVRAWWPRVILVNTVQLLIIILAGKTWDLWLQQASLVNLSSYPVVFQGVLAYFLSTFVYYWWHRYRHESMFFWNLCHQLHHSPQRIEIVTAFYKHPVEIALNSIISAILVYLLLGCSIAGGALYTFLTAVAEYFYHLNLRTPYWMGFLIQRPESHRIHHKYRHHTQNFADLPVWDMLFGSFHNPVSNPSRCGYDAEREDRFEDMLLFRNVNSKENDAKEPLHFLPTCIGCRKRWACQAGMHNLSEEKE